MENKILQLDNAIAGKHLLNVKNGLGYIMFEGKTKYCIVMPKSPTKAEEQAKEELLHFFEMATGVKLPCVQDDYNNLKNYISIGETKFSSLTECDFSVLGESGCKISTSKNNYILQGGQYGIIYAVYDLLKILFDFEVFSALTIRINHVKTIPFYEIDVVDVPDFRYRAPSHGYVISNPQLATRFRLIRIESVLGGIGGPYHNDFNIVPPEKYKSEHPKWYSDDGQQLCCTAHGDKNELQALEETVALALRSYIIENPEIRYIAFNHQDTFGWCDCEACTALKNKYNGANSAGKIIFLNNVRKKLQEWFDCEGKEYDVGQKLVFLAYHGTNQPPVKYIKEKDTFEIIDDEVLLQDVVPWFAETNADYTCPLNEGLVNEPIALNMRGWKTLGDKLLFWTYGANFSAYLVPYYTFEAFQKTYRFAKEQGVELLFDENQFNTKASTAWEELKGYLNCKLAWNTEESVETLINEFFQASYGISAGIMLNIFKSYQNRAKLQLKAGYSGFRSEFIDPIQKKFWDRKELENWENQMCVALSELEKELDTDKREIYKRNIILERASVRYILADTYANEMSVTEIEDLRRKTIEDIEFVGIQRLYEGGEISCLYKKWGM